MGKLTYIVLTNPVPGKEAEFEEWYDTVHVADMRRVPGVRSGRRFRLVPEADQAVPCPWRSLAIYEWDVDDVAQARAALARAGAAGETPLSPALSMGDIGHWFFVPVEDEPA